MGIKAQNSKLVVFVCLLIFFLFPGHIFSNDNSWSIKYEKRGIKKDGMTKSIYLSDDGKAQLEFELNYINNIDYTQVEKDALDALVKEAHPTLWEKYYESIESKKIKNKTIYGIRLTLKAQGSVKIFYSEWAEGSTDILAQDLKDIITDVRNIEKNLVSRILSSQVTKADVLNNKAVEYAIKGDFDKAEIYFNAAYKKDPNAIIINNLGNINYNKDEKGDAISNYMMALGLDADNMEILINLAVIYHNIGKYDKAAEYYVNVLDSDKRLADKYKWILKNEKHEKVKPIWIKMK